jgi:hypothetical protein
MGKCPRCENKGLFLGKEYCHVCGTTGCSHCMILLFRIGPRGNEYTDTRKVVVCSKECFWTLKNTIAGYIHDAMDQAWNVQEKPTGHDDEEKNVQNALIRACLLEESSECDEEGENVNKALIYAYLLFAHYNPNYPFRKLVEKWLEEADVENFLRVQREIEEGYESDDAYKFADLQVFAQCARAAENLQIMWYYNSREFGDSDNPYTQRAWFPENQTRRKKRGLPYQYMGTPYDCETRWLKHGPNDSRKPDSSVDFFEMLVFSRWRKQEELGGTSSDDAIDRVARYARSVREREAREMQEEKAAEDRERERKNRPWYVARAEDVGLCDWCNGPIDMQRYYHEPDIPVIVGYLRGKKIFCSERCFQEWSQSKS